MAVLEPVTDYAEADELEYGLAVGAEERVVLLDHEPGSARCA